MTNQVAQDLEAAAKLVEERGHTQGQYRDAEGHICMIHAIGLATGGHDEQGNYEGGARYIAAQQAMRTVLGDHSICGWNNETGRTAEEVAAKLREAAALAETGAPA